MVEGKEGRRGDTGLRGFRVLLRGTEGCGGDRGLWRGHRALEGGHMAVEEIKGRRGNREP